MSVTYSDV